MSNQNTKKNRKIKYKKGNQKDIWEEFMGINTPLMLDEVIIDGVRVKMYDHELKELMEVGLPKAIIDHIILPYVHGEDRYCQIISEFLLDKVEIGDFTMLQKMVDNKEITYNDLLNPSIEFNKLELVKKLVDLGATLTVNHSKWAGNYGHLELFQWITTGSKMKKLLWDRYTLNYASSQGKLEIIQWAISKGCPYSQDNVTQATMGNRTETAEWLKEHRKKCVEQKKKYDKYVKNLYSNAS
jgi:hypothetical protein